MVLAGCAQTPAETEKARGVFTGVNAVLALSVLFIVGAVAVIGGAIVLDRMVRSRKALDEAPAEVEAEEEADEIVAGIPVGRAAVPRWLYAAYILIPVFAMAYVVSNVAVAPAASEATAAPAPSGPCEKCEITAQGIQFQTDKLEVAGGKNVTLTFHNGDAGVPHNFSLWLNEAAATGGGKPIAATPTFAGASQKDVSFKAPAPGTTWYFDCTVHPAMKGDLEAVAG